MFTNYFFTEYFECDICSNKFPRAKNHPLLKKSS